MKRILRRYQIPVFKYTLKVQHPALFVDMRLGKTIITIRRVKLYGLKKHLIVAPYSTFSGWRDELKKERQTGCVELTGPDRKQILFDNFDTGKWFLTNKESFLNLPELSWYNWDVTILDESTFIKSHKTQVTEFYLKHFRNVKHRWILTGLPDPESELNYYTQLQFLDPNILGISNYWHFENRYFVTAQYGPPIITNAGKKLLQERIAKHCFFLSRKDAGMGDLKVYEKRVVVMPDKIRRIYNKVKKEFMLEVDGNVKLTKYAVTKFGWLRELCCGVAYTDDVTKKLIWPGKLNLLNELVTGELAKTKLVIWCHYTLDNINIYNRFKKDYRIGQIYGKVSQKKRDRIIEDFIKGKYDWLTVQPKCLQYGANLSIASTCIVYSTPLGLELRKQMEDRIIDVTQASPSLICDLVVENSIDELVLKRIYNKETRQMAMRNIIRNMQQEVSK